MLSGELLDAAVRSGDASRVALGLQRLFTHRGESLSVDRCVDVNGKPAMLIAIENGFTNIVEMLLAANVDVNLRYNERTALYVAAEYGHVEITELLLSRGAHMSIKNWNNTALMAAASAGHARVVEVLVNAGADMDFVGPYHRCLPALPLALRKGHVDVAAILLDAGANVEVECINGFTALKYAAIGGYAAIVEKLLDPRSKGTCSTESRAMALIHALSRGFVDIVDMLLDAEPEDMDSYGEGRVKRAARIIQAARNELFILSVDACNDADAKPALFTAVQNGLVDVVEMLLDAGAGIETRHQGQYRVYTPLLIAAERGDTAMLELLIAKGADVGTMSRYPRETPLMLASAAGQTTIVRLLLNYAVIVKPALVPAAGNGYADIVELLLAADASISVQDKVVALSGAVLGGHTDVVKILSEHGALGDSSPVDRNYLLVHASGRDDVDIVDMLLAAGADMNYAEDMSRTALVAAAASGRIAVVDRLLTAGADVTNSNALVVAVKRGHEHIVDKLLGAGMSPHCGRAKYPPVYYAARIGNLAIVEKLLAAGANVRRKDGKDDPTLAAACRNGNMDVVHALIDTGALNGVTEVETHLQAIYNAVKYGHAEVLELLVSRGVEFDGMLAGMLQTASSFGSLAVVRFLLAHGCEVADVNAALREAADQAHVDVVEELLLHGGDLTDTNENGENALHVAATNRRGKAVVELICSGETVARHVVDVNAKRGDYCWTLFEYTRRHRCRESMAALVEMCTDVDAEYADSNWIRAMFSLHSRVWYRYA